MEILRLFKENCEENLEKTKKNSCFYDVNYIILKLSGNVSKNGSVRFKTSQNKGWLATPNHLFVSNTEP